MIDIDWNAPKSGCTTPGCPHPSFHVCYFGREHLLVEEAPKFPNKSHPSPFKGKKRGPVDSLARHNMMMAQQERWQRRLDANKKRDEKIVNSYKEGDKSIKDLQREFNLSRNAIRGVLGRAQKAGLVTIRPRGVTVAYDKGTREFSDA